MVGKEKEGGREGERKGGRERNKYTIMYSHPIIKYTTIQDTMTLRTCHVFRCGVCVCWSILGGLSGMLVGEVIMVHNLVIQTYMERAPQSVEGEGERGIEGE